MQPRSTREADKAFQAAINRLSAIVCQPPGLAAAQARFNALRRDTLARTMSAPHASAARIVF